MPRLPHSFDWGKTGLLMGRVVSLLATLWMLVGLGWGWQHLQSRPIEHVYLSGRATLSAGSIFHLADLRSHTTWREIDVLSIAQTVLQHPRIAAAALRRVAPNRLYIYLGERQASALVRDPQGAIGMVDSQLRLIWLLPPAKKKQFLQTQQTAPCAAVAEAWLRLPRILVGTNLPSLGYTLNQRSVQQAMVLWQTSRTLTHPANPLGNCLKIDATQPYALWLYPKTGPILRLPVNNTLQAFDTYVTCLRQGKGLCTNATRLWFEAGRIPNHMRIALSP